MYNAASGKKLVLNSIIYSFSGILMKCFSFFLLPLYTVFLTTEDYGITSVATSVTGTMTFVVSLSLYSAIMRFYVDLKDNEVQLKRFYGTVTVFTLLSGAVWFAVLTLFRDFLSEEIFSGVDFFPIIAVCLLGLVFTCQTSIYDDILKSQQKAMKSSILAIAQFFVTLCLNILFIVVLKLGALGSLLSILITQFIFTLYFWVDMISHKQIVFCVDFGLLKAALKYSIPIIPHNLSSKLALLISKVLIGGTASLASVGIYSVASQFGDIADTFQGYIDKAYGPWLFEKLKAHDDNYKRTIRNNVRMLIAVLGLLFIAIALFAQDYILLLVNRAYIDAWKYIPLIVLVFSIKTAYYFYVEVLFYHKKASRLIFIATLSSSLVNILLSYYFIPSLGIQGSILADALAMILRVAIVIFFSRQFENVGLNISDFVINFFIIALFIGIGLLPSFVKQIESFSLSNLMFKVCVVTVYIVIIGLKYRTQLKPLLARISNRICRGGRKR